MNQHILMTGATGFVGSHVLDALLRSGFEITILKRSFSNCERIKGLVDRIHVFDIDKHDLEDVFKGNKFDTIIHLSTLYLKKDDPETFDAMYEANVEFPSALAKLAVEHDVKRFINTNTYFQYSPNKLPICESNELSPFNEYAKTKIKFSEFLRTVSQDIEILNFIIFTPFGPKDNEKLVNSIVKAAVFGSVIKLSEGLQKVDLVYVKDIARAYVLAAKKKRGELQRYEDICIASGFPVSVRDLVSLVEEIRSTSLNKIWGEPAIKDYPIIFGDTSKAEDKLGWRAATNIKDALRETVLYYEELACESHP